VIIDEYIFYFFRIDVEKSIVIERRSGWKWTVT